jgi:hypothetical protein
VNVRDGYDGEKLTEFVLGQCPSVRRIESSFAATDAELRQCSGMTPEARQNGGAMTRVTVEPLRGLDADGFAATLQRMYSAWSGSVSGEEGVHRLVQRSPNDPGHRRHSSFAQVSVDGATNDDVVRTYVTFPYRLVKDHRSGRETKNVAAVIAGDLSLVRGDS